MRHEPRRSSSSTSDQLSPKRGAAALTSTGCTTPAKDTNSHSLPRRTAFSVTGSCSGSKNGALRSSFASAPSSSSVTVSAAPLAHSMRKRRDDEADAGGAGADLAELLAPVGVEEGRAMEQDVAQPEPVRPRPLRQRERPAHRLRLRGERDAAGEEPGGEHAQQEVLWR